MADNPDWIEEVAVEAPDLGALLSICRTALNGGAAAHRPQNPQRFLDLAVRHRLVLCIGQSSLEMFDDETRALLKRCALARAVAQVRSARQISALLDSFSGAGFAPMVYKGPVLGEWLYGGADRREYDDLDLMVERRDLSRAREALRAAGYHPMGVSGAREEAFAARYGLEQDFRSDDTGLYVQLGSCPVEPFFSPGWAKTFVRETVAATIDGRPVRTPSRPATAVFLAVHGAKHFWSRLQWLIDFALLWRSLSGVEREASLRLARERRATTMLDEALALTQALVGEGGVAAEFGRELREAVARWGARWCVEPSKRETLRGLLRLQPNAGARIRFILAYALTPSLSDCRAVRLPVCLHGLYPVVRMLRAMAASIAR